ncbi:LacI family transcriptional regulator [Granulicella aggregans]|uniref:LacI family transcriptional regulator n=1 Tax=Granulicella aggregans TaxID=474949 RepID=A0A7W7ZC25_9BACT|nr:LacI family transcriptional regulator [Granulicella aggregans]
MKARARMRDVAELAGVGTMTVSRVISGRVPVSDETRARVLAAIASLDYQPNEVARSLREARTRSIGIIVPNFYDSFFAWCAHAVSQVAQRQGYSVMVTTSSEDAAAEYREASLMVRRNVDGLVVIPAWFGASQLSRPEFAAVPMVTIDRPFDLQPMDSAFRGNVTVDNAEGARLGVEHLISHGHRRILYLSLSNDLFTLKVRHASYVQSMRKAGLSPECYFTCATQDSTLAVLKEAMADHSAPTAIFSSNNLVTQHALHALDTLKFSIPKDVALIGFDDLKMFDIFRPPVTVVRQPLEDLGRRAAEMLLEQLHSPPRREESIAEVRNIVLPVKLVVRRSCGCSD